MFSWVCATSFAYIGNRKVVYKSDSDNIRKEILRFMVLRLSTLVLDMFIMFILVTCIHANDMISKFISIFMITLTNYLFGKYIVFKKDIYR